MQTYVSSVDGSTRCISCGRHSDQCQCPTFRRLEPNEIDEFINHGKAIREVNNAVQLYHPVCRLGMILRLAESLPDMGRGKDLLQEVELEIRRYRENPGV